MLHFGKIPKKMVKFGENSAKFGQICEILGKKQQKIQRFLTKILRSESGAKGNSYDFSIFIRYFRDFLCSPLSSKF